MAHLRSFQIGKNAQFSQKLLNQVSSARICLLNPDQRAAYDEQLRASLVARELKSQEYTAAPLAAEMQTPNAFENARHEATAADDMSPPGCRIRRAVALQLSSHGAQRVGKPFLSPKFVDWIAHAARRVSTRRENVS